MTTTLPHNVSTLPGINCPNDSYSVSNDSVQSSSSLPQDLLKIKEISEKLNLSTRRPSVIQWKQTIEERKSLGQYLSHSDPQCTETGSEKIQVEVDLKFPTENDRLEVVDSFKKEKESEILRTKSLPTKLKNPSTFVNRNRRQGQAGISPLVLGDTNSANVTIQGQKVLTKLNSTKTESTESEVNNSKQSKNDLSLRYQNINQSFEQIRRDLVLMRIEDNKLARKLLNIRSEMNVVRAQWSCQEHADMLDYVAIELEEEEELTGLIKACDLSDGKPNSLLSNFSPLRNIGVSRMNLNSRRFSIR